MPASPSTASKPEPTGYSLVLTGEVLDGFDSAKVQTWLAKTLKLPAPKAAAMLSGRPSCIKQNLDRSAAQNYRTLFQSQGVSVMLRPERPPADSKTPPPGKSQSGKAVLEKGRSDKAITDKTITGEMPAATAEDRTRVLKTTFFNGELSSRPQPLIASTAAVGDVLLSGLLAAIHGLLIVGLGIVALLRLVLPLFDLASFSAASYVLTGVLPALIMVLLIVLLIRPLLSKAPTTEKVLEIALSQQPALQQYIREIYQQVGAPAPEKVTFDCGLVVRGSYYYTFPKLLKGEFRLQLSMPLIATLSIRQLAALVAHEAARYRTRTTGVSLTLAEQIRQRYHHAANNTDRLAQRVALREHQPFGKIHQALTRVLRFYTTVSAKVMWPLAKTCHGVDYVANRLLVKTADHYAVALVGARDFVETLNQVHRCRHGMEEASRRLFGGIGERRLVSNLPALVKHLAGAIPQKKLKQLEDDVNRGESSHLPDYPSDRERIIAAEDLDLEGIDSQQAAAIQLLEHASTLSKKTTENHYHSLGIDFDRSNLFEVKQLAAMAQKDQLRDEVSAHYFNNWFRPETFWKIPNPDEVKSLKVAERIALLNENIGRIRHATPDYLKLAEMEPKLLTGYVNFAAANEVRRAGYTFDAEEFNLTREQHDNFTMYYERAKMDYTALKSRQAKMEEMMGIRLFLGVVLHPDAGKRQLGIALIQILAHLQQSSNKLESLRIRVGYLPVLMAREKERHETEHQKKIHRVCKDVSEYCQLSLRSLGKFKCTFNEDCNTIADFVQAHVKQKPAGDQLQPLETIAYYHEIMFGLFETNRMINSQLATLAKDSEQANKITPVRLTA